MNSIKAVPTKEQMQAAINLCTRANHVVATPDGVVFRATLDAIEIARFLAEREAAAIHAATEIMTLKVAVPVLKERDELQVRVAELEKEIADLRAKLGKTIFRLGSRVRYGKHTGTLVCLSEDSVVRAGVNLKGQARIRRDDNDPAFKIFPHWWCDLDSLVPDNQPVVGTPFDEDLENK